MITSQQVSPDPTVQGKVISYPGTRLPLVLIFAFLPWFAVVLFTGGLAAALNILGYAILAQMAGYSISAIALSGRGGTAALLVSPALGILMFCSFGALWLRCGLPLVWVTALWLIPVLAGAFLLWRDRSRLYAAGIRSGWMLIALSFLICLVYFLPAAHRDAVLLPDGSFQWMYVDTEWFYAVAQSIGSGVRPPTAPGSSVMPLLYHFGPMVPAAVISRITGLDLGNALARVTHGASLWALCLSSLGLTTLLSRKVAGRDDDPKMGPWLGVAGLFFYGALSSMFTMDVHGPDPHIGPLLFPVPWVQVVGQGGPFSHLLLAHSQLHGLIAITAILAICLAEREAHPVFTRRAAILALLPALAVPMNSVSGIYCAVGAAIVLFWARPGVSRWWAALPVLFALVLAAWHTMGFAQAGNSGAHVFNTDPGQEIWNIAVWFLIGLGLRIVCFRRISKSRSDYISVLLFASVAVLLSFDVLLHFEYGQQRYGLYFLQDLFSLVAFSTLPAYFWRNEQRIRLVHDWMKTAGRGLLILAICMAFDGALSVMLHRHTGISSFGKKAILLWLTLALVAGAAKWTGKNDRMARLTSAIVLSILLFGFLSWIPACMDYGWGRMKLAVGVTRGELSGLTRLQAVAGPGEQFATNQHFVTKLPWLPERSFAYGALSGRPVLLEGYGYLRGYTVRGAGTSLDLLLHDNDQMFATRDPAQLRRLTRQWDIQWLVARPGTDLALAKPLPPWLVEVPDAGSLKIYHVN